MNAPLRSENALPVGGRRGAGGEAETTDDAMGLASADLKSIERNTTMTTANERLSAAQKLGNVSAALGDVITVIRDPAQPLGKRFVLKADGKVGKGAEVKSTFCYARMVHVPDHDALAALLARVAEDDHLAIINSRFKDVEVGERFIILSEAEIERRYNAKGRENASGIHPVADDPEGCTKAIGRFAENVEPSAWQILDRDTDEHTPAEFASMDYDAWVTYVDQLLPGVQLVDRTRAYSASSRVLLDGAPVGKGNGHTWIKLENAQDVDRIRQLLTIRAMELGLSWLKPRVSRVTGEVVGHSTATIVDPSVWSRGRIIFVGKPVADGTGLTVSEQRIEHTPGLTGCELSTAELICPTPERVREIAKAAGVDLRIRGGGAGMAFDAYDLTLATEVELKGHGLMTVEEAADLLDTERKIRCQTPFRASDSWAGVLSRGADGRPFVFDSGTNTTHWLSDHDHELLTFSDLTDLPLTAEEEAEQASIRKRNAEKAAKITQAAIERAMAPSLPEILSTIESADLLGLGGRELATTVIDDLVTARVSSIDEETVLKSLKEATGHSLKALRESLGEARRRGPGDGYTGVGVDWPVPTARAFLQECHTSADGLTLRYWQDEFMAWGNGRYRTISNADVRAGIYALFERHKVAVPGRGPVDNTIDALKALINVPSTSSMPSWLCATVPAPVSELIAVGNGLLHVPSRSLLPHTPRFFSTSAVDVTYSPDAPRPVAWINFLAAAFPDDPESIEALQQWFGYLLTQDTTQQKALICVGPKRCGKGTIARVLRGLLGDHNCAGPTLGQLARPFGLQGLIGKSLAIISDARVGGGADLQAISENLLRITGEDAISVERKQISDWVGKLTTRFVLMTNILPGIVDAGGAVASRFIVIKFKQSFFGREDTRLTDKLMAELPGILNWALDGLAKLQRRGAFIQPESGIAAVDELIRKTTPIVGFIADVLTYDSARWVAKEALYDCYKAWCHDEGMKFTLQKNAFFSELYANSDGRITSFLPRVGEDRVKAVRGVRLADDWRARNGCLESAENRAKVEGSIDRA